MLDSPPASAAIHGTFATALLIPSVAIACGGPHMGAYKLAAMVGVLALTAAGYTFLTAGTVRLVETIREFELDRPGWWKTRLWAVGMFAWIAAAAILMVVNALGVESTGLIPAEIYAAFLFTLPLVAQFGGVAWTWHRRGPLGTEISDRPPWNSRRRTAMTDVSKLAAFFGLAAGACGLAVSLFVLFGGAAVAG